MSEDAKYSIERVYYEALQSDESNEILLMDTESLRITHESYRQYGNAYHCIVEVDVRLQNQTKKISKRKHKIKKPTN